MTTRVLFALFLFSSSSLFAQDVIFQSSFESEDGFLVLSSDGTEDVRSTFGYDYADFDDVPEAPNSEALGGAVRTGLKLEANIFDGVAASIAVIPTGLDLPSQYEVQVDAWLNYNVIAVDRTGTTEFGGLGLGHDGEFEGINGGSFLYDTDGDSGSDYRLFKDLELQALDTGQYAVPSLNNSDPVFSEAFPPVDLAEAAPGQLLIGETPAGTGGFRWMTVSAVVDAAAMGPAGDKDEPGIATFTLTDAATGNAVEIGTIDNSQGELAVDLSGNIAILFADLFSSLSNVEELSFGVFDNLIVTGGSTVIDPLDCNGDGSVDGLDVACATGATVSDTLTAAGFLGGDLNLDGEVNFPDFLILSNNFGDATAGGVYANGDVDLDGTIGFPDFLALSANFGQAAGTASAVPEPSGLSLGLFAIGLLVLRRRNR